MADNNKKVDDGEEGKNSKVLLRLLDFIKGDLALFKRNMARGRDQFYQQLGRERDPHCRRLILWLINKWNRLKLEGVLRNEGIVKSRYRGIAVFHSFE